MDFFVSTGICEERSRVLREIIIKEFFPVQSLGFYLFFIVATQQKSRRPQLKTQCMLPNPENEVRRYGHSDIILTVKKKSPQRHTPSRASLAIPHLLLLTFYFFLPFFSAFSSRPIASITATDAICTMAFTSSPVCRTCTGAPTPSRIGPMALALPSRASSL